MGRCSASVQIPKVFKTDQTRTNLGPTMLRLSLPTGTALCTPQYPPIPRIGRVAFENLGHRATTEIEAAAFRKAASMPWLQREPIAAKMSQEPGMELFVHRQNLLFFRKQLAEKQSPSYRLQLLKLLAEEEAKDRLRPNEQ